MKDIEKKIEKAASEFAGNIYDKDNDHCNHYFPCKEGFVNGAKSLEAKEFHTQGMFSKKDLKDAFLTGWSRPGYVDQETNYNIFECFYEWFEQNKKSSDFKGLTEQESEISLLIL